MSQTNAPLPGIRACAFDAYGTVLDLSAAIAAIRPQLGDQAKELATIWRAKQLEYSWLRAIMGRFQDFWHIAGESLDFAMQATGLKDALLRTRLMESFMSVTAFPEVHDALAGLKGRDIRTAILSNGSTTMLAAGVGSAGLRGKLDAVFSCDKVQSYKPDPRCYQLVSDHFGVAPAEVCFVSANAWDVAGAGSFGFRTVWLNRKGRPAERMPSAPDAIIGSLAELGALVAA